MIQAVAFDTTPYDRNADTFSPARNHQPTPDHAIRKSEHGQHYRGTAQSHR
jgi:hypothetical protein